MKERDIKRLFDIATNGEDSGASSEEIKSAVLGKLGKNAVNSFEADEEAEIVQPVFMTAAKKSGGRNIKIAVGTAACLGIIAVSVGFIGRNGGLSAFSPNDSGDDIFLTEETAERILPKDIYDSIDPKGSFSLFDKTYVAYADADVEGELWFYYNSELTVPLLSEENGRLYFVKNANKVFISDWEKADKEDITDKIRSGGVYIYSYDNPENTTYSTHYIIAGGDLENNDFGYAELYKVENDWRYSSYYTKEAPITLEFPLGSVHDEDHWIIKGFREVEKITGDNIVDNVVGSRCENKNLKNTWGDDEPSYSYSDILVADPDDYYGKIIPLKNNSFTLKDGTAVTVSNDAMNVSSYHDSISANWLLKEENGRVYYLGGDEPKDITDLFDDENPYIETYENEQSGLTHYIVIGGDVTTGKYGYAEMYLIREKRISYDMVMNDCEAAQALDGKELTELEWLRSAMEDIGGKGLKFIGGATYKDF